MERDWTHTIRETLLLWPRHRNIELRGTSKSNMSKPLPISRKQDVITICEIVKRRAIVRGQPRFRGQLV